MAYEAKTNWKLDDTVMPNDMNRIEQGIKDVESELENVNGIIILEASTENVIDFNTLTEPGIYLIKNCNDALGNTVNSSMSNSNGTTYTMKLEITGYKASTTDIIYQRLTYNNVGVIKYRSYDKLAATPIWSEWNVSKINASYILAGTFAGQVNANATAVSNVGTAQVRNITASTTDLTAGTSSLATGEIYFVYE